MLPDIIIIAEMAMLMFDMALSGCLRRGSHEYQC